MTSHHIDSLPSAEREALLIDALLDLHACADGIPWPVCEGWNICDPDPETELLVEWAKKRKHAL